MKPFDLEAAKAGKPVVTLDGRKVELLKFDLKDSNFPIAGIVNINDDYQAVHIWQSDGRWYAGETTADLDLFMASTKREGWVNLYIDKGCVHTSGIVYNTYDGAIHEISEHYEYHSTVKIEWEE